MRWNSQLTSTERLWKCIPKPAWIQQMQLRRCSLSLNINLQSFIRIKQHGSSQSTILMTPCWECLIRAQRSDGIGSHQNKRKYECFTEETACCQCAWFALWQGIVRLVQATWIVLRTMRSDFWAQIQKSWLLTNIAPKREKWEKEKILILYY